jgi:hypothetical protein
MMARDLSIAPSVLSGDKWFHAVPANAGISVKATGPITEHVASACAKYSLVFSGGCHLNTSFKPDPLFFRVARRNESFVPLFLD